MSMRFGNDDLGAEIAATGDGVQDLDRDAKGLDTGVDLLIDLPDSGVDRIDMLEEQLQHKSMMVSQPATQRRLNLPRFSSLSALFASYPFRLEPCSQICRLLLITNVFDFGVMRPQSFPGAASRQRGHGRGIPAFGGRLRFVVD